MFVIDTYSCQIYWSWDRK